MVALVDPDRAEIDDESRTTVRRDSDPDEVDRGGAFRLVGVLCPENAVLSDSSASSALRTSVA
jgi:hypothetical protein